MSKHNILIVDDHPVMRRGVVALLDSCEEFTVCGEAGSREQLVALLPNIRPDLAVLDISLDDISGTGLDLIPLLQAHYGDTFPVLIYSMYDEALYAARALASGARGYLMKEAPVRHIIKAVKYILEGKVFLSARMSQELLRSHVKGNDRTPDLKAVDQLSSREYEVFRLLGKGLPPRQIAASLFISVKTVETHRAKIREKLGCATAAELTQFAVNWVHRPFP